MRRAAVFLRSGKFTKRKKKCVVHFSSALSECLLVRGIAFHFDQPYEKIEGLQIFVDLHREL